MAWQRGRIYYSKLPDTGEERKTVLVVSAEAVSEFLSPIVVQVTSTPRIRVLASFVELRAGEGGLERNSYALCHEIATVDDSVIDDQPLGPAISPRKIAEVNRALAGGARPPAVVADRIDTKWIVWRFIASASDRSS